MSAKAATVPTLAEEAGDAHALAFRIAFAAAVGLTLGEVLGWDFPFLPAALAVQLLTGRGPLSVKQGLAFVAVMVAACAFAALLAQILVDRPLVLLLTVSLLIFLEFLLLARGQAMGVAAIFLITTAVVPLLAIESMSVAYGLIYTLIVGSALAVLLTFAAHALFPVRTLAEPAAARAQKGAPVAVALANTAVLMSLVMYFMLTVSPVSIVAVLTVIGILRQPADLSGGTAAGLILGNLVGGLAATVAYILVTLLPYARLSSPCRLAGRASLWRPYRARWRVGTDLHGWPHDLPHRAGPWALSLAAGQRLPLHCPRVRRHGGGHLRHRHGQPVALRVSHVLTDGRVCLWHPTDARGILLNRNMLIDVSRRFPTPRLPEKTQFSTVRRGLRRIATGELGP